MFVIKKDNTIEKFDRAKILSAVGKSANRVSIHMDAKEEQSLIENISNSIKHKKEISVEELHNVVEGSLFRVNELIAKSYMNYRNYKKEIGYSLMDDIEKQVKITLVDVDRENSNSNTRYISTKRTEIAQVFAKEMFQKMFLSIEELQAMKDGYIYCHDLKDLILPQYNCCITDIGSILKGGFELEGVWYNEPKDIRTAVGQVGDVIMVISAQHFGGNSTGQIDKILAPYYKKTIDKYTDANI
ncbi:MAG: anaerobic ribonucleoside-triphosphate reductase, partial [Fusobacteriaceae bacterium]